MITRSLFTLFTALLLGATLSAPMAVAIGESNGAAKSFAATPVDTSGFSNQLFDSETDQGLTSLELPPVSPFRRISVKVLPLQPAVTRSSERPPARASPACL